MFNREWPVIGLGIALVSSAAWGWQADPDEDGFSGAAALGESGAGGGSVDVDDIIGVAFGGNAYTINSSTGVGNLLGPTGFAGFNAMAHLADGRYVATSGSGLYEINPMTGAATLIATMGVNGVRGAAAHPDGRFFVIHTAATGQPEFLYEVNPNTGATTLIGACGVTSIQAFAINASGVAYAWAITTTQGLGTINLATGAYTDVSGANGGGDIQALAFGPGGRLFGGRDQLEVIDTATGARSVIGAGGYSDVRGFEFREVGPPCTGSEKIKKAKCKNGKLKVKTTGGTPATTVTGATTGACGSQTKSATVKANGSATIKFTGCGSGAGNVDVDWECGASASASYNCP